MGPSSLCHLTEYKWMLSTPPSLAYAPGLVTGMLDTGRRADRQTAAPQSSITFKPVFCLRACNGCRKRLALTPSMVRATGVNYNRSLVWEHKCFPQGLIWERGRVRV